MYTILVLVVLAVMFLAAAIRILNEYERAVIFRHNSREGSGKRKTPGSGRWRR